MESIIFSTDQITGLAGAVYTLSKEMGLNLEFEDLSNQYSEYNREGLEVGVANILERNIVYGNLFLAFREGSLESCLYVGNYPNAREINPKSDILCLSVGSSERDGKMIYGRRDLNPVIFMDVRPGDNDYMERNAAYSLYLDIDLEYSKNAGKRC